MFLAQNANGARVRRAGDQALTRETHDDEHGIVASAASSARAGRGCVGGARSRATPRLRAKALAGDEGVVQGARPGEARPPRPGRDADAVQPSTRARRCRRTSRTKIEKAQPRVDQVAGRRQVPGRLEARRADRAGGPRHAVLGRPEGPGRRQLLRVPPALAAGDLATARSARRCTTSASCAATTTRCASTPTARSTTPRRTPRARNMPRFGHSADPHRAADQGRRRAADGSGVAGQQVTDCRANRAGAAVAATSLA